MWRIGAAIVASLIAIGAGFGGAQAATGAQQGADEAEMLARARAERLPPGGDIPADAGEQIRDQAIDAEVVRRIEEAERRAELDAISARLGSRAGVGARPADTSVSRDISSNLPPRGSEQAPAGAHGTSGIGGPTTAIPASMLNGSMRATILLVMTPGDRGIRRYNPSADPILCIGETCWISRGSMQDARAATRAKAFGPVNTLGERAGACNDTTRCVFRNVDLGAAGAAIQPVDLRLMRHDRREPLSVEIDHSCRVDGRNLYCGAPQSGTDYVVWVVPEQIAAEAGSDALASFTVHGRLATAGRLSGRR